VSTLLAGLIVSPFSASLLPAAYPSPSPAPLASSAAKVLSNGEIAATVLGVLGGVILISMGAWFVYAKRAPALGAGAAGGSGDPDDAAIAFTQQPGPTASGQQEHAAVAAAPAGAKAKPAVVTGSGYS